MQINKKLEIWKKPIDLVENVFQLLANFPDSEKYGITNQIKRSSISIPSNSAGRNSNKNFYLFLKNPYKELYTQLIIM